MSGDRDAVRAWLDLLGASNALKKSVDAAFRAEFGLSISRFDVLAALERAGREGLRARDLSERLMVTEGNTTQVTAPLAVDGLVERVSDPDDKRVVIYRLSKKGERLFVRMAARHREWIARAFCAFSPAHIATLRKLLSTIELPAGSPAAGKDAA
jgi:DNA-binding MarR family transcriptional regulator